MTKINHEEYKVLKELDDELKWITRDASGELYVYDEKPRKLGVVWSYVGLHMEWVHKHEHLFQFIQWEDEYPHSIQKLIHDYEYKTGTFDWATAFQSVLHGESKETEVKKDVKMMNDKLEVILDELDEFITRVINAETTSQTIEMLTGMTIEQVVEGFRDGKFDMREELTMTKLETLVVPIDLGEWLQSREIGDSGAYFTTLDALYHHWESVISSPTGSFITDNKKELIEVILGTREYEVEEPLYCALIKGYELLDTDRFYWIYDKYEESVFVSKLYSLHGNFLTEMSKSQWNELGINDSNADFIKVRDQP